MVSLLPIIGGHFEWVCLYFSISHFPSSGPPAHKPLYPVLVWELRYLVILSYHFQSPLSSWYILILQDQDYTVGNFYCCLILSGLLKHVFRATTICQVLPCELGLEGKHARFFFGSVFSRAEEADTCHEVTKYQDLCSAL